jgi:uncharacterized protein YbjT (DUF2867 family)
MTFARVCIAGSTGYLGSRVTAAFLARKIQVTAIVRSPLDTAAIRPLHAMGADVTFIDAQRRESYAGALANVGIAISCMASRNVHVNANSDFWAIDRDANIRFGLAAIAARVDRIMLVATSEGTGSRRDTAFSDAKEQAVDTLGLACATAGIPLTIIRPTAYFSDLTDRAFNSVMARNRYTVIGDGNHRINPVDGSDVASFIADRAGEADGSPVSYSVGGPEIFTYREIGELAAEILGNPAALRVRRIPVDALRLTAMLASAAGQVSGPLRRTAAILRWMIYMGTHDAIAPSCGKRSLRDNFDSMSARANAHAQSRLISPTDSRGR